MSDLRVVHDDGWYVKHRPATPSEIAAAHPKCATCGLLGTMQPRMDGKHQRRCNGRHAHVYDETTDYCPHHTALTNTGAPDEPSSDS